MKEHGEYLPDYGAYCPDGSYVTYPDGRASYPGWLAEKMAWEQAGAYEARRQAYFGRLKSEQERPRQSRPHQV